MKLKRFLGLVLALLMVMSTFTFGFAAERVPQDTKSTVITYGTPVIDGKIDLIWDTAVAVDFTYDRNGCDESNMAVELEAPAPHWAKALWDNNNLYVCFYVVDDCVYVGEGGTYYYDGVEVYFDENHNNDYNAAGLRQPNVTATGVCNKPDEVSDYAASVEDGYYVVEVALPWVDVTPENGTVIGYDVSVNGNNGEDVKRANCWSWNDRTNVSYKYTCYLGEAILAGNPFDIIDTGCVKMYEDDKLTPHNYVNGDLVWTVMNEGDETILTITGDAKTLTFNSKATWNNWSVETVPWYGYLKTITKVVIDAPITAINQSCAFNKLENVHTVVLPENEIELKGSMIFSGMSSLETMGPEGTPEYTLDLRTLYGNANQPFDASCSKTGDNTVTVLMPYVLTSPMNDVKPFSNDTKVLFKVVEGSDGEAVANTIKAHADDWDNYTQTSNTKPHTKYVDVSYYDETVLSAESDVRVASPGETFEYSINLSGTYDGYAIWLAKSFDGIDIEVVGESEVYVDDMGDHWLISVIGGLEKVRSEKTKIATVIATVGDCAEGMIELGVDDETMITSEIGERVAVISTFAKVDVVEKYTVTYNAYGGSGAPDSQIKYDSYDLELSTQIPTSEGYDFDGWIGSDRKRYSAGGVYSGNASLELIADWQEKTYKVTYYSDDNSSALLSQKKYYFSELELTNYTPIKTGYDFVAWRGSDGNVYSFGDTYSVNADLTLTAMWKIKTYTITYNANGGENAPQSVAKEHFETVYLSEIIPTRHGYEFLYWGGSNGIVYFPGNSCSVNADLVLNAVWRKINYGDANSDGSIDIKDIVLLSQYLAGWNVTVDNTLSDCNSDCKLNIKDVVLLAQYLAGWDVILG